MSTELARRLAIMAANGIDPAPMIEGALADGWITERQARELAQRKLRRIVDLYVEGFFGPDELWQETIEVVTGWITDRTHTEGNAS